MSKDDSFHSKIKKMLPSKEEWQKKVSKKDLNEREMQEHRNSLDHDQQDKSSKILNERITKANTPRK